MRVEDCVAVSNYRDGHKSLVSDLWCEICVRFPLNQPECYAGEWDCCSKVSIIWLTKVYHAALVMEGKL